MLKIINAEKLYERDPKIKREDVKILQEWLKKQPHLPKIEEQQIILFLHSCYYRIEPTKNTIDAYFTRRTLYPELFCCPNEDVLRKALALGLKKVLSGKTPQGYSVFLSNLLDYRVEKYNFINEVTLVNLAFTLSTHKDGFSNGVVAIFDFKGASLGHLARVNLTALKRAFDHLQEGAPIRIKGIHMVNTVPFMDKIIALIKPFMSGQLFNLIEIHNSLDTLYKYIPKDCLPEEYGGELPSCQKMQEDTVNEFFDNLDFFKWHDSQKVDESKRIEKSTILDPSFGVEGTFKKLELD